MKDSEYEKLKKQMKGLAVKESKSTLTLFTYVDAILKLLSDKGITNAKEFNQYLARSRKDISGKIRDAEFMKMMDQMKKPGDKGEKES